MRGKGILDEINMPFVRITPAYAGKSSSPRTCRHGCKDHPRLCGEKSTLDRIRLSKLGSPPPMRGKAGGRASLTVSSRITPAYAGKSANVTLAGSSGWDHPRLCGEKVAETETIATEIGSPPPMRGKDMEHLIRMWLDRITPAYAGKSRSAKRHAA